MCAQVEELERFIDAPLHVLYMKQLSLLREKALKTFKSALTAEGGEFEAMMAADDFFRREAEEVGAVACRLGPTMSPSLGPPSSLRAPTNPRRLRCPPIALRARRRGKARSGSM